MSKHERIILDLTFQVYDLKEQLELAEGIIQQGEADNRGLTMSLAGLEADLEDAYTTIRIMTEEGEKDQAPAEPEPTRREQAEQATEHLRTTAPKHMITTRKRTGNTSWKKIIDRLLSEPAGTKIHVVNPPVKSAINTAIRKYQLQHEFKNNELYVWYPAPTKEGSND